MGDPFDLTGKTAIVTGGTKGLGREIAARLLGHGADVVVCARNEPIEPVRALDRSAEFVAAIEVKAIDRTRLLRDVTDKLADQKVNILSCTTSTDSDRVTRMNFEVEMGDSSHLDSVLSAIKGIDSVYDAHRVMPGARR